MPIATATCGKLELMHLRYVLDNLATEGASANTARAVLCTIGSLFRGGCGPVRPGGLLKRRDGAASWPIARDFISDLKVLEWPRGVPSPWFSGRMDESLSLTFGLILV
jgi:hypothetical protein